MAQTRDITIRAIQRTGRGKNDAGRLRRDGYVPLTIYGGDGGTVSAAAPLRELAAILRSETGHNTIFTLDIDGIGASEVLFQDRQIDPIRGRLVHADLKRIVRGQKIEVTAPLHLIGRPIGETEQGGMLEQIVREIKIRCRPRDIPDAIDVDVTHLKVHGVLHVSDITPPEGVELVDDADTVIATVGIVREEAETPVTQPSEPEVIGKGKKEEAE
jgi:large subunit ribosomal protein L25